MVNYWREYKLMGFQLPGWGGGGVAVTGGDHKEKREGRRRVKGEEDGGNRRSLLDMLDQEHMAKQNGP